MSATTCLEWQEPDYGRRCLACGRTEQEHAAQRVVAEEDGVSTTPTVDQVIDAIAAMTAPDLQRISDAIAERWGIAREPVLVDLVLTGSGPNIILAIKAVREITGAGLREARDMVGDAAHGRRVVLAAAVERERATTMASVLREVGATYTIDSSGYA